MIVSYISENISKDIYRKIERQGDYWGLDGTVRDYGWGRSLVGTSQRSASRLRLLGVGSFAGALRGMPAMCSSPTATVERATVIAVGLECRRCVPDGVQQATSTTVATKRVEDPSGYELASWWRRHVNEQLHARVRHLLFDFRRYCVEIVTAYQAAIFGAELDVGQLVRSRHEDEWVVTRSLCSSAIVRTLY